MSNPMTNPYEYDRDYQRLAGFAAALILVFLICCALILRLLP